MRKKRVKPQYGEARDHLIAAAIRCFEREGIAETRMIDVAREAKLEPALAHYHFETLRDLHHAVIRVVRETLRREASVTDSNPIGGRTPEEKLAKEFETYIRGPFRWARKEPGYMSIWMYFYHRAVTDSVMRDMNDEIRIQGRERIRNYLLSAIELGCIDLPLPRVRAQVLRIQAEMTGGAILQGTESAKLDYEGEAVAWIFADLGWKRSKI